jgi:hypothetical protein
MTREICARKCILNGILGLAAVTAALVLSVRGAKTQIPRDYTLREYCPSGLSDGSGDISIRRGSLRMEGRGQHRVLWYRFDYDDSIEGLRADEGSGRHRDVAIFHTLPTVWFVDPFEKKRLVVNETMGGGGAPGCVEGASTFEFESHVLSEVDLESIEQMSQPVQHVIIGRIQLSDGTGAGWGDRSDARMQVEVGVKVHARYAEVSQRALPSLSPSPLSWMLSDTATVAFEPFSVVVRSTNGNCRRLMPTLERVLETQLPAGAGRHMAVVRWVSLGVLGSAVFRLIYSKDPH